MAEKRERLDVIHDILHAIIKNNNEIGPTRLIQLSNLSPTMFREYTKDLLEQKLIFEIEKKNKKYYGVSEKGYKFMEKYKTFKNFILELGI
jgi:predicted transcriptional regulator